MTDADALERRLAAVERALVDGDRDPTDLPDAAVATVDRLEYRLNELEGRLEVGTRSDDASNVTDESSSSATVDFATNAIADETRSAAAGGSGTGAAGSTDGGFDLQFDDADDATDDYGSVSIASNTIVYHYILN